VRLPKSTFASGNDPMEMPDGETNKFCRNHLVRARKRASARRAGGRAGLSGTWTVTSAEPAPWADAKEKPVASDLKALIGHSVSFQRDKIDAPPPLGCRKPHYQIKQYTSDMLFQGGLDKPDKQAATLGFKDKTIKTLETGCDGAIDFHFVDADDTLFALNNRIYKIERKKP
jgi:hypothetical protein